jgi:O-Antigen ligase
MAIACLLFVTSFFVIIEPAPSELLFVVLFGVCLFGGLRVHPLMAPLFILLMLYNLGGIISMQQPLEDYGKSRMFVIISIYMAVTAVFLCSFVAARPERLNGINTAWIWGGTFAAVLGLLGFMDVFGLAPTLTMFGRSTSTFKDPNVFSTYIIYPMVVALHRLLTGETRCPIFTSLALLIMLLGLFTSFSRGAWAVFVLASALLTLLVFIQADEPRLRLRISLLTIASVFMGLALIAILLSIESVRELFLIRTSLNQSYDAGETGRFGNQLNSIPMLLQRPLGFGPLQFETYFPEAPHNVYIAAFASYSWLGGIAYMALVLVTLWIGYRTIRTASHIRSVAVPIFCTLLFLILQGVQIDTDHWRHFYWLLGMMWGVFVAKETGQTN